jgi:hypothetical protein
VVPDGEMEAQCKKSTGETLMTKTKEEKAVYLKKWANAFARMIALSNIKIKEKSK